MPTNPDPRWDDAAAALMRQVRGQHTGGVFACGLGTQDSYSWMCSCGVRGDVATFAEVVADHANHQDTAMLTALADNGLLLTPPVAEVLEAAKAWGRVCKVSEESGEVVAALIGVTGQNPRKGVTHTWDDVEEELYDVALTALAAIEHLRGNNGTALADLGPFVERRTARVRAASVGTEEGR